MYSAATGTSAFFFDLPAFVAFFGNRIGAMAAAVCEVGCLATASGVPTATTCPPPLPPSGPMSIK